MTQQTQEWDDAPTQEIPTPETEPQDDEFLDGDDFLPISEQRTSKVTLALAVALILVIGFLVGVQVQKFAGG